MSDDKNELWSYLGCAAIILALCLGIGSCTMLQMFGNAALEQAKQRVEVKP